jgi:hypothetical protein
VSPHEFLTALEEYHGKTLADTQRLAYVRRLGRLPAERLRDIHAKVVDDCRYFPKIAEIVEAARELGCLAERPRESGRYGEFDATSCKLCGGEGAIVAFFRTLYEFDATGRRSWRRLERVLAYSQSGEFNAAQPRDISGWLYRCSCDAGERDGLPRGWPRWRGGEAPERHWTDESSRVTAEDIARTRETVGRWASEPMRRFGDDEDIEGVPL